ncbi:putative Histone-lysine N-methyltransferase NSD2, partial [Daphnia magna]
RVSEENDFGAVSMHTSAKSGDILYDARRIGARIAKNMITVTRIPTKLESRLMNPSTSRINRTRPGSRVNSPSPASKIWSLCRNTQLHLSLELEEWLDQLMMTIISFIINTRC